MRRHRKAVLVGALVAALTATTVGYALWSVSGSGDAYTKASSSQALTTNDLSATVAATLFPGGDGDVEVEFNNPNVFPVTVTQVDFGAVTPGTCAVTVDASAVVNIVIPAGGTEGATIADAAHMGLSADDACQNQVFTIDVPTVTAAQS